MDDTQFSVGGIYDAISDTLAKSRTKALLGKQDEAIDYLRSAQLEFNRFREVLENYPGFQALLFALDITYKTLEAQS